MGSDAAPQFLTEAWVRWLDSVLSQCRLDSTLDAVLEHCVTDTDGSTFCWHVRIRDASASAHMGLTGQPPGAGLVRFSSDRDTATAISRDGQSPRRAFAAGRLRLEGDPMLLTAARPVTEAIAAALVE